MRPVYLLDTCVVSEPSKPRPSLSVLEKIEIHGDGAAIPSMVLHEILYGICRIESGTKRQRLYSYVTGVVLPGFSIVPYDAHAAWVHADIRNDLEKTGRTISFVDGMIASIAVENNMLLVTCNYAIFRTSLI